jgi:hypothetical protein
MSADSYQKGVEGIPMYDSKTWKIDYELVAQGFLPTTTPISIAQPDCVGSRSSKGWEYKGVFDTYLRLDLMDKVTNLPGIGNLNESLCQLFAFFILPAGDEAVKTCSMPRCDNEAEGAACAWLELPDSLCPTDSEQEKIFPCHLGYKKKVDELTALCNSQAYNQEASKSWCEINKKYATPPCSNTAPTVYTDPPQCCDPLGKDATIPPCNAYRSVMSYAAAAVEITDQPSTALQKNCQ